MNKAFYLILPLIFLLISYGNAVEFRSSAPASTLTHANTLTPAFAMTLTPEPPGKTAAQTVASTPGCQNSLKYYTTAYLTGHTIQLTFDTPFDLNYYRVLDQNGQRSALLNIPGLKVYLNGVERSDYRLEMSDENQPRRLYLRISGKTGDVVKVEFNDEPDRFCSGDVYIPERWVATSTPAKKHHPTLLPTSKPTREP